MATNPKQLARTRRRARISVKVQGTAARPRLSVYRSNTHIYAQLVDDQKGVTLASSSDMKAKKGSKTEKAKEVGLAIAKLAKDQKIETVVFDRNGFKYHGRVKAVAEGAREGGLQF